MNGGEEEDVAVLMGCRTEARKRRDFAAADALLERLHSVGVHLIDMPDGSSVIDTNYGKTTKGDEKKNKDNDDDEYEDEGDDDDDDDGDEKARPKANSGRRRAGRKGTAKRRASRHRFEVFADFLFATFPAAAMDCVVDVAGGCGSLAHVLAQRGVRRTTVVDPRPAFSRKVIEALEADTKLLISPRIRHLARPFDDSFGQRSESNNSTNDEEEDGFAVWQEATIVVGLHADQPTEAIVDAAVRAGKPFAVVPCCVFPSLFPDRTNRQTGGPVREYDEFVDYLKEKHEGIHVACIPNGLGPRNKVIYRL